MTFSRLVSPPSRRSTLGVPSWNRRSASSRGTMLSTVDVVPAVLVSRAADISHAPTAAVNPHDSDQPD